MLAYIPEDDGYTLGGYIAEVKGLHPAVRFTFRPMLHRERLAAQAGITVPDPAKGSAVMAAAVARHIRQWDIEGLEPRRADRLLSQLLEKMYGMVAGYLASDPDPENAQHSRDMADEYLDSLTNGELVGSARDLRDSGN